MRFIPAQVQHDRAGVGGRGAARPVPAPAARPASGCRGPAAARGGPPGRRGGTPRRRAVGGSQPDRSVRRERPPPDPRSTPARPRQATPAIRAHARPATELPACDRAGLNGEEAGDGASEDPAGGEAAARAAAPITVKAVSSCGACTSADCTSRKCRSSPRSRLSPGFRAAARRASPRRPHAGTRAPGRPEPRCRAPRSRRRTGTSRRDQPLAVVSSTSISPAAALNRSVAATGRPKLAGTRSWAKRWNTSCAARATPTYSAASGRCSAPPARLSCWARASARPGRGRCRPGRRRR